MTNQEYRAENMPKYKKWIRFMWLFWILGVIGAFLFFFILSGSDDLPSTKELQNPKNNLATEVLASDGSVIGRFYVENRVKIGYEALPDHLVDALIATEDKRFYNHAGIDLEALGRVMKGLAMGSTDQGGGSTITQQLAKQQYSNRSFSGGKISRMFQLGLTKFKEWITAVQLEKRYTKEEIITMYLNEFDFLYGAVGIKSAAETYFGKPPQDLEIQESAMLVGMLKNPSLYNPLRFPEKAKLRREVVLKLMMDQGHFGREKYDELRQTEFGLNFSRKSHSEGIAPYFREQLRMDVKKILAEEAAKGRTEYNVHTDGLKIFTTLDPQMQTHAETAAKKIMKKNQKLFWKEWKDKDPWTYKLKDTKDEEIELRVNSFMRILKESERYTQHKVKFLSEILEVIQKEHDLYLKDYDIERMLKEEEESGYLSQLVKNNFLTKEKSIKYRKIMKDDAWDTLKEQYEELQKAVEKDFKKKTKMKIFSHDDEKMEVDTIMSPWDSIRYMRMHLQTGVVSLDPKSGAIRAWVGGVNHKWFKFDHVNLNVERQVGSTFKPFVYATAIEQMGISPCYKVADIPYTIHKDEGCFELLQDWTPKNFGEYTGEEFSLYKGLEKSKNTVSAYLMKQIGCYKPVRDLARAMGIEVDQENVYGEPRVPKQPSICLGATDLSVVEMTGAYATFANQGVHKKPYFIERIEDRNGTVIYQELTPPKKPALSADANYVMIDMLKRVAKPIQWQMKSEVGGKTGTTNLHADAWFMGLTPNLVTGVWVGGDDRWIRFRNPDLGQGGILARPIFVEYMKGVEKDTTIAFDTEETFVKPPGELGIRIDCRGIYGNPADGEEGMTDTPSGTDTDTDTDASGGFGDEYDDDEEEVDMGFDMPEAPEPSGDGGTTPPAGGDAPVEEEEDDSEDF